MLRPILLYSTKVWDTTVKTNLQKNQTTQNKTLRMMTRAPWYKLNSVIHQELNIEPIRNVIKPFAFKFYNKLYSIPTPELFNNDIGYDIGENWRRPKGTTILSVGFHELFVPNQILEDFWRNIICLLVLRTTWDLFRKMFLWTPA